MVCEVFVVVMNKSEVCYSLDKRKWVLCFFVVLGVWSFYQVAVGVYEGITWWKSDEHKSCYGGFMEKRKEVVYVR